MDNKPKMNIADNPMYKCKGPRWHAEGQEANEEWGTEAREQGGKEARGASEGGPMGPNGEEPEKLGEKPDGPPSSSTKPEKKKPDVKPPSGTKPEKLDTKTPPGERKPTPSDSTVNIESENPLTENPDTTTP
ncbi:hypothetical protein BGX38DRAFT_1272442 [Terfezia claveryi]|nr:hypothetical protein BGX38DRAFT_1272442 [Terfezia claveryi]